MSRRSRRALTDEERAQRREAERQLARHATEALLSSDGWQRWLHVRSQVALRRYSLTNQLLLALQLPTATRVAGFRAWLRLGYCVRKGEHALRIFAPMPPSKHALERWRQQGADPADKPPTRFRLTAVFDRSQVDELPPPAEPTPLDPPIVDIEGDDLAHLIEPLTAFAEQIGSQLCVEPVPGPAQGYYETATRRIVVDDALAPNGQVKVALHELAHALVRCDRRDGDPDLSYAEEELVAECVAYIVCATAGYSSAGYSAGYLASWSEAGDLDTLEDCAGLIDRLAARLEEVVLAADSDDAAASPDQLATA